MSVAVKNIPVVRYVVADAAGLVLGVVTVHGYDEAGALLLGSKRWRLSQTKLRATDWDECDLSTRAKAANRERDHWQDEYQSAYFNDARARLLR